MEIGSWIWIFALCTFSAFAQTWDVETRQKINSIACWNYGKNRSIIEAPGVQNFNDCGRWNQSRGNPPWDWDVFLRTKDGDWDYGVLLSDKTIIFFDWYSLYRAHKEGKEIKIYAGKCEDKNDEQKCFGKRGLLQNKKILNIKMVELKYGRFYSEMIFVCQIEKLELTSNLQPACLWNWGNTNDEHENYYASYLHVNRIRKSYFLPEQRCYGEERIEKRECDLYGNSICTSRNDWSPHLFIEREKRFYLRALRAAPSRGTTAWVDLLPFLNEITSASVDLASMPKIPKTKSKIDFGPNQSFANCGRRSGERRRKREAGKALPLVTNGENAVRGDHPWHASVSIKTETGRKADSCGATLISKKVLVTAAHCLFDDDGSSLNARHVDVTLGMHNRSNLQENRQKLTAASLVIHPGYDHSKVDFKDDIALVILAEEVNFNDFVRPICLWNDDYDLNKIANKSVTLVGWGFTVDHEQPQILQKGILKIVSYQNCYESNNMKKRFFSLYMRPTENFCAGIPQTETNACVGDSGGGLTFYDRDDTERHFLRGVVSMGSVKELPDGFVTCNPKFYALYTDVTNYMDWIVRNSPDINV
ncbi:serine protease persephone-like [Neocloeon triangulifer]|uniref:serine protease persephone-like n=1 Tax=Neocloeon triangulifer TaxID=2078957 RepID=UPI00286F8527|nr:serine protease persephone-like [Neocloeon triangulifer]